MAKQFGDLMKKAQLLCGFFLLCISTASANADLDSVLAKQCWFSGTFTQEKFLKGLPVPLKSDGKFLFDCDRGLIWHTASPIVDTKIYTISSSHFALNDKHEIEVLDSLIQTTIASLLLDIMSANTQAIANNFAIKRSGSNSISLTPNSAFLKKGIQSILLKKGLSKKALTIELVDNKSQSTRIHSVETHQSDSKQSALANCQTHFINKLTCDILDNPSSYETVSN